MGAKEENFTKSLDYGIKCTIMAVREQLMQYFKGTNVETVTRGNLTWRSFPIAPTGRRLRSYEAHGIELKNRRKLIIGSSGICMLEKNPDSLELYNKTFQRSEEMTAVFVGLQDFLDRHLRGVKITVVNKGTALVKDDRALVMANSIARDESILRTNYEPYANTVRELQQLVGRSPSQIQPTTLTSRWSNLDTISVRRLQ